MTDSRVLEHSIPGLQQGRGGRLGLHGKEGGAGGVKLWPAEDTVNGRKRKFKILGQNQKPEDDVGGGGGGCHHYGFT